jgi:hypothetical protein
LEYRKKIDLEPDTEYWFVEMGPLNFLNGGSSYPFTALEKAMGFAVNHKWLAKHKHGVDREVSVRFPDGTVQAVELGGD